MKGDNLEYTPAHSQTLTTAPLALVNAPIEGHIVIPPCPNSSAVGHPWSPLNQPSSPPSRLISSQLDTEREMLPYNLTSSLYPILENEGRGCINEEETLQIVWRVR